jgi:hypothetical protein
MQRLYSMIGLLALAAIVCGPVNAQTAAQPVKCADEVKKAQNAPELRVQGGSRDQESLRAGAALYLQEAAQAAQQNDEKQCWDKLNQAKTMMRM